MSRAADLLKAAATALDDGRDPLTSPFLGEHDVSLNECYDLAEQMAMGARLLAWALENPKLASAAMSGAGDGMAIHIYTEAIKKWGGR